MSATEPKAPDRSLSELVSDMTSDVSLLIRKEMELARVELKEEVRRAGKAGGILGAGAFVGYLGAVMLSFAAAWGLSDAFDRPWPGFLIVGIVYAFVAAVLLMRGRDRLKDVNPVPEQTVDTLKEDVQWLKDQRS